METQTTESTAPSQYAYGTPILPTVGVTHMCDFLESPRHYYYNRILKKREATPAMEEGIAFHALILEPEKFYASYCTDLQLPEDVIVLKTVDEMKDWILGCGQKPVKGKKEDLAQQCRDLSAIGNPDNSIIYDDWVEDQTRDKKFISKKKWDDWHEMRESVLQHKFVQRHLELGKKEVFVEGEIEGHHVRGRCDWVVDDPSLPYVIVIDVKKTRSAKFFLFRKTVMDSWLFVQAALYVKLLEMQYKRPVLFCWLACEATGPKIVECYSANEAAIEAGERAYKNAFKRLAECREKNSWPAYTDGMVNNMDLASYKFDEIAGLESEEDEQ